MNKVAINMYVSIITLNVIGLNAPIKRHNMAEWINMAHIYSACKRLASDLKTFTDWK